MVWTVWNVKGWNLLFNHNFKLNEIIEEGISMENCNVNWDWFKIGIWNDHQSVLFELDKEIEMLIIYC